jgi:hypothetical protein
VRDWIQGCLNKALSMSMFLWTCTPVFCGAVGLLSPSSAWLECDVESLVPDYTASLPRIDGCKNVKWLVLICGRFLKEDAW